MKIIYHVVECPPFFLGWSAFTPATFYKETIIYLELIQFIHRGKIFQEILYNLCGLPVFSQDKHLICVNNRKFSNNDDITEPAIRLPESFLSGMLPLPGFWFYRCVQPTTICPVSLSYLPPSESFYKNTKLIAHRF